MFIHEWWNLHFKFNSERQIIEKLFLGIFIYTQSIYCREVVPAEIFFHIPFRVRDVKVGG